MAIKTRKPASPEAIEAFGAAADQPVDAQPTGEVDTPPAGGGEARPAPRPRATPAATRRATPEPDVAPQWPRDLAKTVTLRYPDPTIPQLLAELAAVSGGP